MVIRGGMEVCDAGAAARRAGGESTRCVKGAVDVGRRHDLRWRAGGSIRVA
jgi:hypothetical protein